MYVSIRIQMRINTVVFCYVNYKAPEFAPELQIISMQLFAR